MILPTSDLPTFVQMLNKPNTKFENVQTIVTEVSKLEKSIVYVSPSDRAGCGHIRTIFPFNYLNSINSRHNNFQTILSQILVVNEDILVNARSFILQKKMELGELNIIRTLKKEQSKYNYKLVYDIDDFIWEGDELYEGMPKYNPASNFINKSHLDTVEEIMGYCDKIAVSTKFLGEYIRKKFNYSEDKIVHVPNTVAQFFWGSKRKRPIKEAIKKPRIIWTASSFHWDNKNKLYGDMNQAWIEWIIKNVKDNKIEYIQMGGEAFPWFFECIKDKVTVVNWVQLYGYPNKIMDLRPDFGIAPLCENYFNFSKSNIKALEQYAIGSAFIGGVFEHNVSPYDDCMLKVKHTDSMEKIDEVVFSSCEPEKYNGILKGQYDYLINNGLYTESKRNIDLLMSLC